MGETVWIQANQLSRDNSALAPILRHSTRGEDVRVLMIESEERSRLYPYHKRKLVLLFSAMRHFAAELRKRGLEVDYYALEPEAHRRSFRDALRTHLERHRPSGLVMMELLDRTHARDAEALAAAAGIPLRVTPTTMMLTDPRVFAQECRSTKRLRMEEHYRGIRKRLGVLMEGGRPVEGRWNTDRDNRRRLPKGISIPAPQAFPPDAITRDVIAIVNRLFAGHAGTTNGWTHPVTHRDAIAWVDDFVQRRLPFFGAYQDAMLDGESLLFHSLVSPLLNIGLLSPLHLIKRIEHAYEQGSVPLNSAEGFVRQVIGWREYMYGVYWLRMPRLAQENVLHAQRPLPRFFWTGETRMHCLASCLRQAQATGYLHHIQRLMVVCNFATLAGLAPRGVLEWFMTLFLDAYEWVMIPNVMGMGLFADGGGISTKPYVSGGAYINRMSDYCSSCAYRVRERTGPAACPFNYLYWNFLFVHRRRLGSNPRMGVAYRALEKKSRAEIRAITQSAGQFLEALDQ
jgi:deoxyribodipyrimidine photolyase-related protein